MTYRSIPVVALLCSAAVAQNPPDFPPSKPYLQQMRERGALRAIGLRDALELALAHNLEIEIENYGRDLARAATTGARSYYDPQLGFNASVISSDLPVSNILQTGNETGLITRSWTISPSIQQNLPGGGSVTAAVNLARTSTNSDYMFINPLYGSSIGVTFTQPLWRGFRRTAADRQIVVTRISERFSESQFRQKVAAIVEQVITAYWKLVVTVENYEAQRQGRDVAVEQYEQARRKAQALASARADVASREQSVIQSEVQIIQAGNALKRLLAPSVMDPLWSSEIVASEVPDLKEPAVSLPAAVKTAIARRPELEQLQLQIEQSEAEVRFARQEAKPVVNLRVELLSSGNAGRAYALQTTGLSDLRVLDPMNPAYGGPGTSFAQSFRAQYPSVAAGLEVKLPLRNRAAVSQLTTSVIGSRKLQTQIRATEEDILVEVRNAWESIAAQKKNVEAARLARKQSEEEAAEAARAEAGESKNLEILRHQRDVAEARVRELQALVDYQLAVTALEKAMNTLADEHQIVLARRN